MTQDFSDQDLMDALERMTEEEVCEAAGIPKPTLRARLARAKLPEKPPKIAPEDVVVEEPFEPEWLVTSEMSNLTRLSANALRYRLEKGLEVNGKRLIQREHPNPPNVQTKYQWALVPHGWGEVADVDDSPIAPTPKVEPPSFVRVPLDDQADELAAARQRIAQLEQRLAADAKAAAARIDAARAKRDSANDLAHSLQDELNEWKAEALEARQKLDTLSGMLAERDARLAECERIPDVDVMVLHRAIGALDAARVLLGDRPEARVMGFVGEMLAEQL